MLPNTIIYYINNQILDNINQVSIKKRYINQGIGATQKLHTSLHTSRFFFNLTITFSIHAYLRFYILSLSLWLMSLQLFIHIHTLSYLITHSF